MNRFSSSFVALSIAIAPLALVAQAKTPKPTPTPKPKKTPKPTATPTRAPIPVSASGVTNGKTIFVARGGLLELRLEENPSTGYGWTVVQSDGLKLEGEPAYKADSHAPGMVGGGGTRIFRFRAIKVGKGTLGLDLRAPGFKAGDKPAETYRSPVRVLK